MVPLGPVSDSQVPAYSFRRAYNGIVRKGHCLGQAQKRTAHFNQEECRLGTSLAVKYPFTIHRYPFMHVSYSFSFVDVSHSIILICPVHAMADCPAPPFM